MKKTTIAHLSDLHIGSTPFAETAAYQLCQVLIDSDVDHVVVTGDVTHSGRLEELVIFRRIFGPLFLSGRMTVVPGNHDRLGDDLGRNLMVRRVDTVALPGAHLVRLDTTGAHNRFFLASHGDVCDAVIDDVYQAVARAPSDTVVALLLHHPVLPLLDEPVPEGSPMAPLRLGAALVERLRGRCNLVLHGHHHQPRGRLLFSDGGRPLAIYNAGSSTELGRARLFTCAGGRFVEPPRWLIADGQGARELREEVESSAVEVEAEVEAPAP